MLERGNFRGLKLTEQAIKVTERIADSLFRQVVTIDESQFGYVPDRGTADTIFQTDLYGFIYMWT